MRADELAEFASELTLSDVPGPVQQVVKDHLLDTVGVSLACVGLPYMQILGQVAPPAATGARVLGSSATYPAVMAALLTGSLSHGNDYDDSYVEGIVHPTGPALAAALAMSGSCTGADLLAAVTAGVEVTCRVAQAVGPAMLANGVHPTSACGVLGATAAAGRAAGLTADQLANALALAAGTAGGLHQSTIDGSWNKRVHGGLAARAAVTCCELARAGMTAPREILEDGAGPFRTFGVGDQDLTSVTADLGRRWEAAKTAIKVYPACQGVHPYVDCALALRDQVSADDVDSIELRIGRNVGLLLCEPPAERLSPSNGMSAKFSLPYTVAYALRHGRLTEAAFNWRESASPEVLALASRVRWEIDPAFDVGMAEIGFVSVTTKASSTAAVHQPNSRGSWQNPLSTADVRVKFTDNVAGRLGTARTTAVADLIEDIEAAPGLARLFDLCFIDAPATALAS